MALETLSLGGGIAADTVIHPSNAIWNSCPIAALQGDDSMGFFFHEDFKTFGKTTAVASNVGRYEGDSGKPWISYEDTSCTITQLIQSTPDPRGIARFSITTSAEKSCVLEMGYGTAYSSGSVGPFMYTDALGGKLWFEARLAVNSIGTNSNLLFVGLAQSGCAVVSAAATSSTTLFDSTAGVGQVDLLGFDILSSAPSAVRCVYGINGASRTSAGAAQTAVATTFYKLGFIIDPQSTFTTTTPSKKKMRWFVNGVEVQNLTDTSTSPFPTAKVLTPTIHFQSGSGTSGYTMDIDWIRGGQIYTA